MNLAGLDSSFAGKFPYQLSTGEQLRVCICRACYLDPPVLLMDEPFGSVDVETRKEIQKELLHFQRHYPRTILLVTHDVEEAVFLADNILILDGGDVQQIGESRKVLPRLANLRVRHLLQEALIYS